ncbi:MAG: AMP-binding protein [Chloroflexota bacterium]
MTSKTTSSFEKALAERLRSPRANTIRTRADWEAQRQAFLDNPGAFQGAIGRSAIHWYDRTLDAWITWDEKQQRWTGLHAKTGAEVKVTYNANHSPWERALNDDEAPFYRWFEGGLTNACFNEVDRHVLMGYGDEAAFYFEGDRWDSSLNEGRGGPLVSYPVTRKRLLLEVVKAAQVLNNLGLKRGDRIALNMPSIVEQIYYTEAAKRLGIIYTPVFGGFSDKTLSDRIHNAGARVVITSDGGYRNAQIVTYKEVYTDQALDKFIPVKVALEMVRTALQGDGTTLIDSQSAEQIVTEVDSAIKGEVTIERSDVMRGVGRALDQLGNLDAATQSRVRTAIAQALVAAPPRVDNVIVVRHTGHDILWRPERDVWSHDLLETAMQGILEQARGVGVQVQTEQELLNLPTADFIKALYASSPAEPLDADFPMFIIYTSGSTGKPKGVVHVHGGYTAGLTHTMSVSFDAEPGDVVYVIADPGWITGQSYMLTATLSSRCTGVIAEGAPVFPSSGRFASIIERYGVNIFKAGVTFLKSVMTDSQNVADVRQYDMSTLRVCTFCAEPVSPAVQQFGMDVMSPQYINSYWATEHGGIVWTHFFGNDDFPLRADARTYPLPWIVGDVWTNDGATDADQSSNNYRVADYEEKGEIVITTPYPYLARTIWGDTENFKMTQYGVAPEWRGDYDRFEQTYWRKGPDNQWAYIQGDFAMKYEEGSFSLHGRSDDVINVSGHRMGTEEIEGAILRDKQQNADSPVGNCIVVGAPHREKGLTPVAFILTPAGRKLSIEDRRRLSELVRAEKGVVAVPEDYIEVSAFPETRSGKYMRRFLRSMMLGEELGDTTTLRNPEILDEVGRKIEDWKRLQTMAAEQKIFERYRYFLIEYHPIHAKRTQNYDKMAVVTITNPPVNALNERSLDELNTIVDHLTRRDEVKAIIFTGQGTKSFVAGADIRQLLEETHSAEDAIALPNNAHPAFRKIERMNKPCIAAINGVALGGGLEFALACHYRIADTHAEFGQPEINLRLLPGYGGTQRLPRLLQANGGTDGLLTAIELILGGRNISATEANDIGLVDIVAQANQDALSLATAYVREYGKELMGSTQIPNGSSSPASILAIAFERRKARTAAWETPSQQFVTEEFEPLLRHPRIERIVKQAHGAGRARAVERSIEAMRFGLLNGLVKGLSREAHLFAEAVVDPEGGKRGIQEFLDKHSAPLPTRRTLLGTHDEQQLLEDGDLLPIGAPVFPGITPIPRWQYAQAIVRDDETGAYMHGDPLDTEHQIIIPVEDPTPNQALLYVLASEVNFNDIWAITGIPVSQFDEHDRDWHVSGSGGIGLIVALGEEARLQGRLKVGNLVTIYSGQSDLLSPMQGLDPMFANFGIQGYNTPDGSHQQFMLAQAPQCMPLPPDLSLESAGSYILNLGTIYRALFTILQIQPGRTIFIEGAATGTGLDAVHSSTRNGLRAMGMVSSPARAETIRQAGAQGSLNRKDPRYKDCFTRVPEDPTQWRAWERAGHALLDDFRAQNDGHLADYAVSHAGEQAFPRTFQMLGEPHNGHIPTLTFYGASSGYHFTFLGKPGAADPVEMLQRVDLRAGEAVLMYYGVDAKGIKPGQAGATQADHLVDQVGLEAIEATRVKGARIVVVTYTDAQREFVLSLGFGASLRGVVSIETLKRRYGDEFDWPETMPELPEARADLQGFKDAIRDFNDLTFKPIGGAVGSLLRSAENPRGYPDLIIERAGHDTLAASSMLVKPYTGRIVYYENMDNQRYSFFAPQIWMRQRRIYMPTANIWGTHLCNAHEILRLNDEISAGLLSITEPELVEWGELARAHQEMWDNRHAGATYIANHALPRAGLKTKDDLYAAWEEMTNAT